MASEDFEDDSLDFRALLFSGEMSGGYARSF